MLRLNKFAEWSGAITGLLGSVMVAMNSQAYSRYGFIAYILSDVFWLIYGIRTKTWSMVFMQLGFTVTAIIGIYNWF